MAQTVQENLDGPKWSENLVSQHHAQNSVLATFFGHPVWSQLLQIRNNSRSWLLSHQQLAISPDIEDTGLLRSAMAAPPSFCVENMILGVSQYTFVASTHTGCRKKSYITQIYVFACFSSLFLRGYLSRPVWQLWTGLKYSWYNRHDLFFLTMMIKTTMMMKLYADDRWKIQPLHLRSVHSKHCAPQQGRLSRLST